MRLCDLAISVKTSSAWLGFERSQGWWSLSATWNIQRLELRILGESLLWWTGVIDFWLPSTQKCLDYVTILFSWFWQIICTCFQRLYGTVFAIMQCNMQTFYVTTLKLIQTLQTVLVWYKKHMTLAALQLHLCICCYACTRTSVLCWLSDNTVNYTSTI